MSDIEKKDDLISIAAPGLIDEAAVAKPVFPFEWFDYDIETQLIRLKDGYTFQLLHNLIVSGTVDIDTSLNVDGAIHADGAIDSDSTVAKSSSDIIYFWHKIANPTTGWRDSKAAGWTADSFSAGLTTDFTANVTAGTKAIMVVIENLTAAGAAYWRKGGDSNISNTPHASQEYSHLIGYQDDANWATQATLWLSDTYTVDFAVSSVNQDLYISYPFAELR